MIQTLGLLMLMMFPFGVFVVNEISVSWGLLILTIATMVSIFCVFKEDRD